MTHFFAPAWRSLAVEVITWEKADPKVVDYLMWMFAATGKTPMMTDNAICFMLDRVWDNWTDEAAYLLHVATAAEIDHVAEEFVPAGPFFVMNMAHGNPITYEANTLQMEEGDLLQARPDPALGRCMEHKETGGQHGSLRRDPECWCVTVSWGSVFSQSFDIIDRGVGTLEDLNFGTQIALAFRKGPMDYMRDFGETEVAPHHEQTWRRTGRVSPWQRSLTKSTRDSTGTCWSTIWTAIKVITMRRPQAMNAINDEMSDEITATLRQFEDDPETRGFILTGYGTAAFSAGADIGGFPKVLGDRG